MRKKNKYPLIEQVTIQNFAAEGKCLVRHQDRVIFVAGSQAAPGDVVDLQIIKKHKKYFEAKVVKYHQLAPERIAAFCSHFGTCGGCKWQHIPYSLQLQYKQQQVIDNLTRIGKLELPDIQPIIGSKQTEYYRNKLEFTFSNWRWLSAEELNKGGDLEKNGLGFHIPTFFDRVLDIEHCYLQAEPSNAIRLAVKEYALQNGLEFFNLRPQTGFLRNLLIRSTSLGDWMVAVVFAHVNSENEGHIVKLLQFLQQKFPQITSLQYFINPKRNDSFLDLEPILFAGKPYIEEEMEGLRFRIGAKSFYQTNSAQAVELYKVARQMADLQGNELVYDLYTGTGTIANFVARQARQVIGLEYVSEAIADARINSQINQINNTLFFAGDIKDLLNPLFLAQYGKPEVIITDPPRAGMHEDVIRVMMEAHPHTIVYVSCNPATQARDLAILAEKYTIAAVQPVDMFPHTHHVENVVKLVSKG
ncbi:MAG: 23S rRNA (uracil(1939)-C(5))-methyltransferase RlmD [Microscillaceae bacterium]|jgi:23S rRNA (uracil1939-C5)-methyltransferase|nr:23S rRNA (uracil(1939)-C(5))-methyltransferase RlmD [Microscillaceae bacterium]